MEYISKLKNQRYLCYVHLSLKIYNIIFINLDEMVLIDTFLNIEF